MLFAFPSLRDASTFLSSYLKPGDLVLLKGSHKADHLHRLILARTTGVKCWRWDCARQHFCDVCELLRVPSDPEAGTVDVSSDADGRVRPAAAALAPTNPDAIKAGSFAGARPTVVVVGLGNPEARRSDSRHNVGYRAVEILAQRMAQDWRAEGNLAQVCRGELEGTPICLIKPLAPMNDIGPPLLQIAKILDFNASRCILVHDDLDLPFGSVRARHRGGDGGHRGVRSILQAFQDDKFRRVKIGIGSPAAGQSVGDFVLTPFPPEQLAAVDEANRVAADQVIELIRQESIPATGRRVSRA